MDIKEVYALYQRKRNEHADFSPRGKGKESAYGQIIRDLLQIEMRGGKDRRDYLKRTIQTYEAVLEDSDPVFDSMNETLRNAANDLKKIKFRKQ